MPFQSSPLLRKPLWVVTEQETHEHHESTTVERHLSLFDLVSVGVGGTIGSGIFVLTGYIAHYYAGPATTISFFVSGVAACCSGLCYAELAGRIPASGSTYAYAYVALGEVFAVLAASCLTLEYMVSGAAVARSWGDKVVLWLRDEWGWTFADKYLSPGYNLNPLAGILSALCVLLLMDGVKESKMVTNVVTMLKVALVVFMIVGGFWLLDGSNLTPFVPYGTSGIFRGATSSFFGYLGYDEVCCLAGEALHPARDMPRAVLLTLSILTLLYVLAALALCGMMPYDEMSDTSAFPAAFRYNGVEWAAQISAFGEVLTLPVGKIHFSFLASQPAFDRSSLFVCHPLVRSGTHFAHGPASAATGLGKRWTLAKYLWSSQCRWKPQNRNVDCRSPHDADCCLHPIWISR